MAYNFKDFDAQFPDDAACLDFIFRARYAGHTCECGHKDCFHRRTKRRAYECAWCGSQIYPTAGTIFHKSETSLKSWFFAIFLFAKSKNGVAAKELQRQLGVTYKTAHRMGHKIRELMAADGELFAGVVEADETYIGETCRTSRAWRTWQDSGDRRCPAARGSLRESDGQGNDCPRNQTYPHERQAGSHGSH